MKIKRKALSILSCFALLVSSIPSTTVFVSAEDYTSATEPVFEKVGSSKSPCVFANGTPITVKSEDGKVVVEYSFGGQTKKLGEDGNDIPENVTIFGGSHKTEGTLQSSEVIIDGVKVHGVFGGGLHKSHVETATVTVKGNADLDFVQGGGASSYKGLVDQCQWYSGDTANATTKVDNATVKIEGNECNINTVFGGGEGISYTGTTNVTVEGGNITFVGAGGSNGYTGTATVEINGGTIGKVQSVNRGTMDSAAFDVSGGTIDKFYIGGEKEDSTVTGTITKATVNIKGGKVNNMYPGTSGGQSHEIDVIDSENYSLGHKWGDWKAIDENSKKSGEYTPVTCTEDGWQYRECSQCGAEEYKAVVHEGHKWADDIESNRQEWTKATCTEPGSYKLKCTVCGKPSEEHTEAALKHDLKKIPAKAPTCTEDGNILYWQCQRVGCGKLFSDAKGETPTDAESIIDPKTGHKNTQEYPAVAPTCRQSGSKAYVYCKDCDCVISIDGKNLETPKPSSEVKDQIFVSSDPSAHAYSNLLAEAKAPTCTEDGSYAYFKCKYCGNYYKIIDEKAKTYEKIEVVEGSEPTAEDVKIPALGHDWDWTLQVTKEPTCIAGGEGEITCKRCDEKEIVIIDKNPSAHKYKNDGICQLCGQKVLTQSGSNATSQKATNKNNTKIVKIINSRNKTKVKIKKKKIIIKFSRRGGCKYRIKIYNKKNKEISLKVKQDYMKGNGKKKFKKFYQIKKKGNYRIEIYELKGMKEKNFKDVKCIYLNYKTIK